MYVSRDEITVGKSQNADDEEEECEAAESAP